jgi:uncharacterized protein YdeI (YjbR/CyaY-like superfamily)
MTEAARRQSTRLLRNASQAKPPIATSTSISTKTRPSEPSTAAPTTTGRVKKSTKPTSTTSKALTTSTTPNSSTIQERLLLPNAPSFRTWLSANASTSPGVWLVLAKKGTTTPTSLTRFQALDEALCFGWIDSQLKSLDQPTCVQRFTPRRSKSVWSKINVANVERLRGEGRMMERGEEEVRKAQGDGRWERAYAGPRGMEVPGDVQEALEGRDGLRRRLDGMKSGERYALLLPVLTAQTEGARRKRVERLVGLLEEEGRAEACPD